MLINVQVSLQNIIPAPKVPGGRMIYLKESKIWEPGRPGIIPALLLKSCIMVSKLLSIAKSCFHYL